jgi:hypothetical protein
MGENRCAACGNPIEPVHTCHDLCEICCREVGEGLARLDADMDSQADGHK